MIAIDIKNRLLEAIACEKMLREVVKNITSACADANKNGDSARAIALVNEAIEVGIKKEMLSLRICEISLMAKSNLHYIQEN